MMERLCSLASPHHMHELIKVNRRKILKYTHIYYTCRMPHATIGFVAFLIKCSYYILLTIVISPFALFLSLSLIFHFLSSFHFLHNRFRIHRTNFRTAERKFQRLCWSWCNTTCPSHPITFVLFATRFGRLICTVSTWDAAGTSTC